MAQFDNRYAQAGSSAQTGAVVDAGLRSYMLTVYNYMAGGLVLTGLVAYALYSMAVTGDATMAAHTASGAAIGIKHGMFLTPLGVTLYTSPLKWVLMLAPLAFCFLMSSSRVYNMSITGAQTMFWSFAAVMGASLSVIFLVYTTQSIAQVFFITAASFACLSVYGYTTKTDMSGIGTFLIMGVFGLIIASIVNIFLQSQMMTWVISCIGVLVFAGLTAYDTQAIKDRYYIYAGHGAMISKSAILGALNLYLDFINMFQSLLSLLGDRD